MTKPVHIDCLANFNKGDSASSPRNIVYSCREYVSRRRPRRGSARKVACPSYARVLNTLKPGDPPDVNPSVWWVDITRLILFLERLSLFCDRPGRPIPCLGSCFENTQKIVGDRNWVQWPLPLLDWRRVSVGRKAPQPLSGASAV